MSSLVVPLVAGVRTVGLVVLEADAASAYPPPVVARVTALTGPAALRLEAALLFDEVRSLATNEERQRLAREIHDGVAQELVMVGYGIDNALATLPEGADETAEELRTLRGEVTRVITELRLSLFELRSEVDRHGGLAAAIAEYARTVGASGRAAGALHARRVDRPAARRRRGRAAAHRPGGDHQRPQARRARRICGSRCDGRPAVRARSRSPTTARASADAPPGRPATALRSWPRGRNVSGAGWRSRRDTPAGQPWRWCSELRAGAIACGIACPHPEGE